MAAVFQNLMPFATGGFISRSLTNSSRAPKPAPEELMLEDDQALSGAQDAEGDVDNGWNVNMLDADPDEYIETAHQGSDQDDQDDQDSEDEADDFKTPVRSRRSVRNAVKLRPRSQPRKHDEDTSSVSDAGRSSATSSEVEAQWDRENPADGDGEDEPLDPSRCIFCSLTEDEDPGEEFELMLKCAACPEDTHAHAQCARENDLGPSEDPREKWRCPSCVDNRIYAHRSQSRRQSSAARMVSELEPVITGNGDSHTIFDNPILEDDSSGARGRMLRKRKVSNNSGDEKPDGDHKKQRRGSSEVITLASHAHIHTNGHLDNGAPSTPRRRSPGADGTPSRQRTLRQRKPFCFVVDQGEERFVVSFNLGASAIDAIRDESRKKKRRDRDRARRARRAEAAPHPMQGISHYPALQSTSFPAFFDIQDRDSDLPKVKPYGGVLTELEADTTRTFPQPLDRKKFETARLKAEDLWKKKLQSVVDYSRSSHKATSGPPSKIKCIHFGGFEIDTWHSSPYPEEYSRNRVLHVCEFCLKYMNSDFVAWRHKLKCPARHPPGDEIYHDGSFSFFEVDGRKNPVYCQNLCLLAKLFLGSKTLYYDVEPFLFYVMTENDNEGCHFVGYFSKEKRPSSQNNVSCILVLPIHQRRGFGHMLIEFSYLLTRVEGKTGSPEKPLSDMGLVSYRNYWRRILCVHLLEQKEALSITDISEQTGMTADDIVCALEGLRALVRDPITKTYALRLDRPYMKQYIEAYEKKAYKTINPHALMWVPYVMGRENSHYENAISTVAQREEEPISPTEDVRVKPMVEAVTPTNDMDEFVNVSGTLTPFPPLESPKASPVKKRSAPATPSTPSSKVTSKKALVPATRFEVFPLIPGMQPKKKLGRPFGTFRSAKRLAQIAAEKAAAERALQTPPTISRPAVLPEIAPPSPVIRPGPVGKPKPVDILSSVGKSSSTRRTRSKLTAVELAQKEADTNESSTQDADGDYDDMAFAYPTTADAEGDMEDAEGDPDL